MNKAGYEPVWEDGREHGIGWRDANGRYEAIKRYLVTCADLLEPVWASPCCHAGHITTQRSSRFLCENARHVGMCGRCGRRVAD